MKLPFAESFKTKMVEAIRKSTREEREEWIKKAKYNLFNLKSEQEGSSHTLRKRLGIDFGFF